MRRRHFILLVALAAQAVGAQSWRQTAAGLGTSGRVLIIGTRPEDEDNALIAWLSLGHHIEVAYLSLTRGESGVNLVSSEKSWSLGVVRTAELLEERKRDGAHQYFTRAFDFGSTSSDSVVNARWTHDILLADVVAVVRAFRPHVIISMSGDSTDRDATHRVVARLAREAFAQAGDAAAIAPSALSNLPPWSPLRLFTRADAASATAVAIDVGELDRVSGTSYAEIGAEIRGLQRTQPPIAAPSPGHVIRYLHLEAARDASARPLLFAPPDTSFARFQHVRSDRLGAILDTVLDRVDLSLAQVHGLASTGGPDAVASALAQASQLAARANVILSCFRGVGVASCMGTASDLGLTLDRIEREAARAALAAANVDIDATVGRERVAQFDSVPLTVLIRNGSGAPIVVRHLSASAQTANTRPLAIADSVFVPRDSVTRLATPLRMDARVGHWWQQYGLISGTSLELWGDPMTMGRVVPAGSLPAAPILRQQIIGEDRLPASSLQGTVSIAGVDVSFTQSPLLYRSPTDLRGDQRHPLAGVNPLSVLIETGAHYERAGLPISRLFPVSVISTRASTETVTVSVNGPPGLKIDTATRIVVLPPYGGRAVYFGLAGKLQAATDSISVTAHFGTSTKPFPRNSPSAYQDVVYDYGILSRDYDHIPTQDYFHSAFQRLAVVDLKLPAKLRVAYLTTNTNDDIAAALGELKIQTLPIQPALLAVADLTPFTTVLIAPNATADESFGIAVPALRRFMLRGGTVVVLPQGPQLLESGVLPYPLAFDSVLQRVSDPESPVTLDPKSPLLTWPNRLSAGDFAGWNANRARDVPSQFDPHYKPALLTSDPGQPPTPATLLITPVGKGTFIYSALSLDQQLVAIHAGGARILANLLSAGLPAGPSPK